MERGYFKSGEEDEKERQSRLSSIINGMKILHEKGLVPYAKPYVINKKFVSSVRAVSYSGLTEHL